jgi:hypothetical protein
LFEDQRAGGLGNGCRLIIDDMWRRSKKVRRPSGAAARVILYHRHVGQVLVRDWSTPMDLFTATVAASADTWQSRDMAVDHTTAEYVRPFPARSNYLDATISPAPWPTRPAAREQRGGRPMLGAERRLTGSKRAATLTRTAARPL